MNPKINVCTGECCASFTLHWGAIRKYSDKAKAEDASEETKTLAEMLKWTGRRTNKDAPKSSADYGASPNQAHYTCKHFNTETKLCTIYENRPEMCAEFPYDGVCGMCGLVGPTCTQLEKLVWCCTFHMAQKNGTL